MYNVRWTLTHRTSYVANAFSNAFALFALVLRLTIPFSRTILGAYETTGNSHRRTGGVRQINGSKTCCEGVGVYFHQHWSHVPGHNVVFGAAGCDARAA